MKKEIEKKSTTIEAANWEILLEGVEEAFIVSIVRVISVLRPRLITLQFQTLIPPCYLYILITLQFQTLIPARYR